MQPNLERRKAPRCPIRANVVIHKPSGQSIPAAAVDISTSGMLVRFDRPVPFCLGEVVTVDVELPADSGQPFSNWGIGRVVRLDGERTAIQLRAGNFGSVP